MAVGPRCDAAFDCSGPALARVFVERLVRNRSTREAFGVRGIPALCLGDVERRNLESFAAF
jgi:hypothetical protein